MNLSLLTEKYDSIIQAVDHDKSDVPTLFVNGSKSNYIQVSDRDDILKVFPNAQFYTIEDAGHWVHAEKGEELLEQVLQFLHQ